MDTGKFISNISQSLSEKQDRLTFFLVECDFDTGGSAEKAVVPLLGEAEFETVFRGILSDIFKLIDDEARIKCAVYLSSFRPKLPCEFEDHHRPPNSHGDNPHRSPPPLHGPSIEALLAFDVEIAERDFKMCKAVGADSFLTAFALDQRFAREKWKWDDYLKKWKFQLKSMNGEMACTTKVKSAVSEKDKKFCRRHGGVVSSVVTVEIPLYLVDSFKTEDERRVNYTTNTSNTATTETNNSNSSSSSNTPVLVGPPRANNKVNPTTAFAQKLSAGEQRSRVMRAAEAPAAIQTTLSPNIATGTSASNTADNSNSQHQQQQQQTPRWRKVLSLNNIPELLFNNTQLVVPLREGSGGQQQQQQKQQPPAGGYQQADTSSYSMAASSSSNNNNTNSNNDNDTNDPSWAGGAASAAGRRSLFFPFVFMKRASALFSNNKSAVEVAPSPPLLAPPRPTAILLKTTDAPSGSNIITSKTHLSEAPVRDAAAPTIELLLVNGKNINGNYRSNNLYVTPAMMAGVPAVGITKSTPKKQQQQQLQPQQQRGYDGILLRASDARTASRATSRNPSPLKVASSGVSLVAGGDDDDDDGYCLDFCTSSGAASPDSKSSSSAENSTKAASFILLRGVTAKQQAPAPGGVRVGGGGGVMRTVAGAAGSGRGSTSAVPGVPPRYHVEEQQQQLQQQLAAAASSNHTSPRSGEAVAETIPQGGGGMASNPDSNSASVSPSLSPSLAPSVIQSRNSSPPKQQATAIVVPNSSNNNSDNSNTVGRAAPASLKRPRQVSGTWDPAAALLNDADVAAATTTIAAAAAAAPPPKNTSAAAADVE